MKTWLLRGLLLLAGLLLLYFILWVRNRRKKHAGILGERRTARVLRRYARRHRCILLNNVYLPLYESTTEIDHLLFGSFGIAVVETKHISGTLSGRKTDETLRHTVGKAVHTMRNPIVQNQGHINNLRHHLTKQKLSATPLHSIVVFSNPALRLEVPVGVSLDALPQALDRLPDRGCNPKTLAAAVRAVQVRSPLKKLLHDLRS